MSGESIPPAADLPNVGAALSELGRAIQHLERRDVSTVRDPLLRAIADRYRGSSA